MVDRHKLKDARKLDRQTLTTWTCSPRAQRLLALEAAELGRLLPDVFGRHVLQIGNWGEGDALIASSETLHHAVLGSVNDGHVAALIEGERLPLMSGSVDAVVLPHTLEFVRSPHPLLREVDRVLNDRGRLFILGFSPWSLWSWRNRFGFRHRAFPASAQFYSAGRVADWLELLDFEIAELRRYGVGFPWLAPRSAGQAWSPGALLQPLTETYLLVARKRVLPMNFIGRTSRAQVKTLVGIAAPAANRDGGS